jgi:peptidoglycan/xylan/chitin deacetylase (PgdA/CDA1 family)
MNVPQVQNTRTASRRRNRLQNRIRQNRKLGLIAAFVIGIAIFCYIRPSSMFGLIFSPLKGGQGQAHQPGENRLDPEQGAKPVTGPQNKHSSLLKEERERKVAEQAGSPNELGVVPIIMYHVIGENEAEWVRTPENFRKDLERFYRLGYSLVPLQSYLSGSIDLPAGTSPLAITFDDATAGQFRFITKRYVENNGAREPFEHKVPDPKSAVGILIDFSREHPGFGCAATFFVDYPAPFEVSGEVAGKLNFLLEHGMEIGNHTHNHRDLSNASPDVIRTELGKLSREIYRITGSKPMSLALPYGGYPKDKIAKGYLMAGEYEGTFYENHGVLLVGAEPALSPYHRALNLAAIPRIRGSEEELSKWLIYLDSSGTRYVSDGKPGAITILEGSEDKVAASFLNGCELVIRSGE